MLSKNTVKFIKTLHQKKYRNLEQKFFVEGEKSVLELLNSDFEVELLLVTERFFEQHQKQLNHLRAELLIVTQKQLESVGQFQSNDSALAVAKMKSNQYFENTQEDLVIALDDVRDPGNLGTIIRIADWYGIKHLLFSSQTAEFYNPKVIQASMGSFTRVKFYYGDLKEIFKKWDCPIYGAYLGGSNIHQLNKPKPGILLMGNESNGISEELAGFVTNKITIPGFGSAESLNVAIATAILCDNFKRLAGE
ncbi:TrmH family RNA methyltransferase [Algoriphagus iocasae]|jgi:RNA methyltransferase, TrmH family|uniref:TrmH family RNA methyltransferase n=1 Tax=Algoriphagus iocasae TaxID=1836499 RepID=A0A841MQA6_9BACT|nr:RNA methyltransferase [Algoriphagus iocasae]MBB6327707.1 TrmH family RNA methyltransferase [Algoriphagus iocasae]